MAIKKSTLGAQFFQRPLSCRAVLSTPFLKNIWVPLFSENLPGTGIMYQAFFPLRSPTFCHIFRVPSGVRYPSFVVIRQRVRAPGRSFRGGGVTQTFFIRGCAILALNIAPINPAELPKKIPINPENKSLVRH